MGVVYKARHLKLNRVVALKMILAGGHAGKQDLDRFRTEAEAVARLQHPNVVQIYEVGEQDGLPFFSLEFVGGGSLAGRLNGEPLGAKQAAKMVEDLARAMHYAHQQGIIHRDLKPANVLLTPTPQPAEDAPRSKRSERVLGVPKITDFGLAKQLDSETGRTQEGSILGTPSYMAPEQAGGRITDLGPATDVYALGAILYELLTGRPPFRAASPLDTVLQVVNDEPLPPTRLQPKIPRNIETICLKCLEKAPARRYPSAEALAEDLRRFREDEPIQARPAGLLERGLKWVRRRPAIAALSAGILLVAVAGFGLVSWQWLRAEGQRNKAEAARADAEGQKDRAEGALTEAERLRGVAEGRRQEAVAAEQRATDRAESEARAKEEEKKARAEAEDQRGKLQRLSADLALDKGLSLCDQGNTGRGLLWIARSLEMAPADATEFQQLARLNLATWQQQLYPLTACLPNSGGITSIALSPNGKTALTGGADGKTRLWNATTGEMVRETKHSNPIKIVAFSPSGRTFLTADEKKVSLWDAATGNQIGKGKTHNGGIRAAILSRDDETVLVGTDDKTVFRWNLKTDKQVGNYPPLQHSGAVRALAFSHDGKLILTGTDDRIVYLWDADTGKPRVAATTTPPQPMGVRFGRKHVVTPRTPESKHLLECPAPILAVGFTKEGKILTGTADKFIRHYDEHGGRERQTLLQHPGRILGMTFSPDGSPVLTAGNDSTVRMWIGTFKGRAFGPVLPHPGGVREAVMSADHQIVLTRSQDETARVWSTAPPRIESRSFSIHKDALVTSVAFSPDGAMVLTASHDKTARLWDAKTGKPLIAKPLEHKEHVLSAVFSHDGKKVLTGSKDKTARLWDVRTGAPCPSRSRMELQ